MALDFLAGCVGGAAGVIVGHPLDTVKVRLQTQSPTNIQYRGTFHCLSKIVKQESVTGLYKGISSPLFGVAGVNAIIFGVYGALRPYVSGSPGNDALWAHFGAGSISGAVQSVVASPMELVKTRLQINQDSGLAKKLGPVDVLKGIYRNEGGMFRGVFKGWGITLAREIPGFGFYFASYEAMTRLGEGQVGTLGMMLAGGMAGVISWIVTFPIDVVKTRLQCDDCGKYRGAFDCARKTYAAEGYRAFSRGLVSTVIRAFPTNAATFTVVTWIMRLAGQDAGDDIQNSRQYLDELLHETSRLQEKLEESIRLKVPHYLCGANLTSSLASQCAASARRHTDRTQVYFNFYQSLQQQNGVAASGHAINETQVRAESEGKGVGVEAPNTFHEKLVELSKSGNSTATNTNMQALQSTCISSRVKNVADGDDEAHSNDHNRNDDSNAVVENKNHILSTSKSSSSSTKNRFEREINASPVPVSCDVQGEKAARRYASSESGGMMMSSSSLIHGNAHFSHEAVSLPVETSAPEITAAFNDEDKSTDMRGNGTECFNQGGHVDSSLLTQEDLNYLSKSLDIPAHILRAASFQQRQHRSEAAATTITSTSKTQAPAAISSNSTRASSSNSPAQAWKKYCKTPSVNLCRCFEDHCVCYL